VPGASEVGDKFGRTVASADFDRDGYADLAVGQPRETVGGVFAAGAVTVIYGSARGLHTLGYPYPAESSFGATLGG
jgi:hypothetical protein